MIRLFHSTPGQIFTGLALLLVPLMAPLQARNFFWPTPLVVSADTPWEKIIQPAASGVPATGLFGTARNNGTKFHEGLDIRPAVRDGKGEAADVVRAVMAGEVAHVVPVPNGPFGRYVVLWHQECGLRFYTLYAHLRSVSPGLKRGVVVGAGGALGVMGRSDEGRGFPKERAHLHFELGMRLSENFTDWYAQQRRFATPNRHGNWNGLNLNGVDPLPFLRAGLASGKPPSVAALLVHEQTALTVHIATNRIPHFVRDNPALLGSPLPMAVAGWKIEFAWHGLPVRWTPLATVPSSRGVFKLEVSPDAALVRKACVRGLLISRNGHVGNGLVVGEKLEHALGVLFHVVEEKK